MSKTRVKRFIKSCIDFTIEKIEIFSSRKHAKIASEGSHSVVVATGYNAKSRAKIGSWITLVEWRETSNVDGTDSIWIPMNIKTEYVDGKRIKEDTFYRLVDGEFKEVESEE